MTSEEYQRKIADLKGLILELLEDPDIRYALAGAINDPGKMEGLTVVPDADVSLIRDLNSEA